MDLGKVKKEWHGVFPAITTPLDASGAIDFPNFDRHISILVDSGIRGLVVLGSLGENNSLRPAEKQAVLRRAVEAVQGRIPVIAGVSEFSTDFAVEWACDVERMGGSGLMVMPAMVYRADRAEALHHYRTIANSTSLPIIAYNNPVSYPVDLDISMMEELADCENILAIKESSADTRRITDLLNAFGDRFTLFAGVDDLALECAMLGCKGWIAGIGLAFPKENQMLWDLMMQQRWSEALEIYRWYMPLLHLDIGSKFVQKIKLALAEVGFIEEHVRSPRLPLSGEEREQVLQVIRTAIAHRPALSK